MVWASEIESAKFIAKLKTSKTIIVAELLVASISLLVKHNLKKLVSGAAAANGESEGIGKKEFFGDCVQWTTKDNCSRGEKCGMNHDPEKNVNPMVPDSPALQDGFLWEKEFRKV